MMKTFFTIVASCFLMLAVTACGDGSCYDNGNSLPLVRFYMSGSGSVTVSGLSMRGVDAPGDSLLINNESLSETYLPLRATKSSTQWIIQLMATDHSTVADTLTINYDSTPYFASAECGAMFSFDIKNVSTTHNIIDSVVVKQSRVTNVNQETMRIYFKKQ